ncbi:MAG TPA: thioesterase family protein [Holophagaceae bacterium]|nr:thioesterase family protein [Holophagaceae bacterium]
METVSEIRVRYAETDQMGIVHHANYVVWLELGRSDWMRARGKGYAEIEAAGFRLVVNGVQVHYRAPARYDELVQVRTHLKEAGRRKVVFGYVVERDGQKLAEGESVHLVADDQGRAAVLPEALLNLIRGEGR